MSNPPPSPPEDIRACIVDACTHLDAAARLIEAGHSDDPFHPHLALAAQVSLLAAAVHPGIQADEDPEDPWDATAHLDHALDLLNGLPPQQLTDERRRRCTQLAQLHDAIDEASGNTHPSATPR